MLELLPSPDYFERAFGRRNSPIPGARLWNAGRNRLYVANDDPLFSRQLSFLRDDILARIGESRCAKRHRERDGRAPGQPTEPVERSHGGYSAAFFLPRQEKPTAKQGQIGWSWFREGVDSRLRDQNDRIMVKSLAGCEGAEDAEKTDVIFIVEKCCNIDELASCDLLKRARAVFPRDDS